MLVTVVILLVVMLMLFYASYSISAGFYLKSLCINRASSDRVAITFDDGVDPVITPKVLDVLKKHNAKATFFIIGEKAAQHPETVRAIVAEGHAIGNHSYHHTWKFPMQSQQQTLAEIERCSKLLKEITGAKITLFRPPFGVTNPMIGKAVRRSGLVSIGWSIRSLDTIGQDIERVKKRVFSKLHPGKIILLHDNQNNADKLLEDILIELKHRSLEPVTIYELFDI